MIPLPRITCILLASLLLGLHMGGCTYYQTAPGVYAPLPSAFERSWSAAVGALEEEGVRITNLDRHAGKVSGSRGGIGVTATVQTQSDSGVRVQFDTSGDTASDPTLIDRITRAYHRRMGR
jgi:hypothetical protein